MADEDDVSDVEAVLAGDVERFDGIVERWQGPLVNLAWRFVRNEHVAEELAQEAFLKCFRRLSQWRRDSRFSTWLFALALNVYRSHLRGAAGFGPPDDLGGLKPAAPLDHEIMAEQERELVRRAVAHLPAKYRDPLILFYFQEEDVGETARILRLPAGTIKARLHRGRALLKERLQRWMTR
ncbi:MAG TPA: sigma-70 family RNA polymerase sigma factor [Thermoanaerobaculia bacterium]|nr:sigma-70 family RNA polymerase sigma factor [Thermoanaerobaculia bacterium]